MFEYGYVTAKSLMMSIMLSNDIAINEVAVEQTYCMSLNIYYEARGESWKGKSAVAHVVQNRVAHEKYPDTICGVVLQAKLGTKNQSEICVSLHGTVTAKQTIHN